MFTVNEETSVIIFPCVLLVTAISLGDIFFKSAYIALAILLCPNAFGCNSSAPILKYSSELKLFLGYNPLLEYKSITGIEEAIDIWNEI